MHRRLTGLWRNPDFLKLWGGQTISQFGAQVSSLAIPLTAVLTLHANASEMGYLTALEFLPFIVVGLAAGVWVDRMRRRPILIAADFGRAIMLGLIPLLYLLHALVIVDLYVIGFIVGCLTVFFDVAYMSFLPAVIEREQLVEGNSKLEISRATAQITGPGIAGALIQIWTAPLAILVNAASFLVSVASLLWIRNEEPAPAAPSVRKGFVHEAKEGLGVIFGNRLLWSIAGCTGTSNLFSTMGFTLLALYAVHKLGFTPATIGSVLAIGSIGGLLGAMFTTRVTSKVGLGRTIVASTFVSSVGMLFAPLAGGPHLLVVAMIGFGLFLMGLGVPMYNINQVSLRQAITPHRLQGRMNASMRFIVWGTMPLGSLAGGALGTAIGLRPTLFIGAIGSFLAVLWVFFSPVRALQRQPDPVEDPVAMQA